jgi:hypothetical protein
MSFPYHTLRRFAAGLAFTALAAMASVSETEASDSATFRGLVAGQMSAFSSGDAAAAWSYAAPGIQRMFQTPERFIAMVRRSYAPVHAPRRVSYGDIRDTPRGPELEVFVTGPKGRDWLAVYSFEQQADGSWKISGCRLEPEQGASV